MYDGNKDNGAAQRRAYERRNSIGIGQKFLWRFKNGYCTSGELPEQYMGTDSDFNGDKVLTVIGAYHGSNWFGKFVDYCLEDEDGQAYIINGVDAFKMERVKE